MLRRDFITGGAAAAGGLLASRRAAEAASSGSGRARPNILFIWTDQQTRLAMSNSGNPHLFTPAMDSLAREGVVFERAYCSDPICVPSRTSWITGRMPHETTVTYNVNQHPIAAAPVSALLRAHGYDTGYVGKWHIPHDPKDAEWHGFDYVRHAKSNGIDPVVPGACVEFIRRPREKPFFLTASLVNPHDICEWARMAAGIPDKLPNGAIPDAPQPEDCPPLPANFPIPEYEPSVIRRLKSLAPSTYPSAGWTEGTWRQYIWAYHRLIEKVDAQIGSILQALRDSGQDDETLIIFSSDHGDGAGAHQWNQKTLFYEEVAGVPFIVRPPRCARAGARDARNLVNMNLDFFPTVFDYAGIPAPEGLQGRSVRPLVEGVSGAAGHPYVISQSDLAPEYGVSGGVLGRMLRTTRYKYVSFSEGYSPEQLFDLDLDPGEMRSLVKDPEHRDVLARHRELLDDWLAENNDPFARAQPVPLNAAR